MSRRRTVMTVGIAAGAMAGGVVGAVLKRRRAPNPEASEQLSLLPPDDLGTVRSFDGTELAVRASGDPDAPLLVFAHGFSLDLTTWHYQWSGLSGRFRCVLFDFRSHGRSAPAHRDDVSIAAMAHDLAAVVDSVAAGRRAVVVSHSMGAMTTLAMAESRPDVYATRLSGVVLSGVAASDLIRGAMGSVTEFLRPRLGSVRQAADRMNRLRRYVAARPGDIGGLVARMTQFGPEASHHVVDYVVELASRAPTTVWTDGLAGLMDMDLRHAVQHVRIPALVVVGDHDRVTPPSSAVALAGDLPQGRLEMIRGAGHLPMLEAHVAFNEAVAAFADEVLGVAPAKRSRRRAAGPRTDR